MKKNLFSIGIVNLINGIAGIAFIPLAMKSLGAEGYGIYSIFVILTSYIYFVEMGVAKYFTRLIAQSVEIDEQRNNMQSAVGMYIRIALILLVATPILAVIVPLYIFPSDSTLFISLIVILAALDYLLSLPTTIQLTYNIGKENFEQVSKFNLFSGLSKHLVLIASVVLSNSVLLLIIVVLLRRLFDIIYAKRILVQLPNGSWKPKYKKGEFKKILSQSLLLSAAQLTQVTILSLGTFLVNKHFSMKVVGEYKSVFDLATKVWFFSNSIGMVVFPRFASMLKNDDDKVVLKKKIPLYFNISWFSYNSLFLGVLLVLPMLPNFLMIQNLELFFLLLLGVCMNAHTNLSYEYLQADSKLKEVIFSSMFTLVLMVLVFYLLLDKYDVYSIGISWICSQFINSIIMDFIVLKNINKSKLLITISINIIITLGVVLIYGG